MLLDLFAPRFRPNCALWNFLFSELRPPATQRRYVQSSQSYKSDGTPPTRKYYPCYKCGNPFTRKNNLYNHLKFQCGQLPKFNCPYCNYRTKHSSNVRSHVRRIHPGQRVYVLDLRMKQESQPRWTFYRLYFTGSAPSTSSNKTIARNNWKYWWNERWILILI